MFTVAQCSRWLSGHAGSVVTLAQWSRWLSGGSVVTVAQCHGGPSGHDGPSGHGGSVVTVAQWSR